MSTWPCCWLYLYPGRTAFSPKELLSSANKDRIWLLPILFPSSKQRPSGWYLTGTWWSVHKAELGELFRDAPWVLAEQCHGRTESFPWFRVQRIFESFTRFRPAYFWAMLCEFVLVYLWHSTCISGMVTRVAPCSNLCFHIHMILVTKTCQSSGNHENNI